MTSKKTSIGELRSRWEIKNEPADSLVRELRKDDPENVHYQGEKYWGISDNPSE
jgi:hypothetical protein